MKNYIKLSAVGAVSLCLAATLSQAQEDASWLFVLTGTDGHTSGNTLTVTEDDGTVFGFTDRPNRNHTFMTGDEFAALWEPEGDFSEDHPNAVLTYVVEGQPIEVEIILDAAEATGSSFTFTFETVSGEIPDDFGVFSVFIDGVTVKICTGNCFF